ncbi:hypothetical protein ABIA39_005461 [Nocardia sp. GAS34]|uniref:SSI family serine proteinase inhibitor n=1 Tax=unclassified Nocardia TaxID=2637762 RepID=UPI003D211066
MPRMIRILSAAPIFALSLAASAVTATAAPPDPATAELTLTLGRAMASGAATGVTSVTLTGAPGIGGTHPPSHEACAALERDNADFEHLPHIQKGMCPFVRDPVSATATGNWHGRGIDCRHTYANSCVAAN